jgi:DNA-binding NtrC family response regulator
VNIDASVLVVDNDPLVRLGTVVMLRDMGFAPLMANSAQAARDLAPDPVLLTLLVTDFSMPDETGVSLARDLSARSPDLRVLIVTGHDHLGETLPQSWKLLRKPFTSQELKDAVSAILA